MAGHVQIRLKGDHLHILNLVVWRQITRLRVKLVFHLLSREESHCADHACEVARGSLGTQKSTGGPALVYELPGTYVNS